MFLSSEDSDMISRCKITNRGFSQRIEGRSTKMVKLGSDNPGKHVSILSVQGYFSQRRNGGFDWGL